MAVNTSVLKIFAPAMRRQLIDGVGRKLDLLINTKTPDTLTTYAKQIENLREEQDQNREKLIEKVAYTWFNRLCALRFLDAKGWHPFSCKVLMPAEQDETQPELLKMMRSGSLPTELKRFTNEQRLNYLLDNQIPTAQIGGDPQAEVYRELIMAACRSYHHLLPDLFEALDDATELLLPDDLLTENSIAGNFRKEISDEECEDVEIIGWLYQFYISEKKDEVIGKVVKSEDIPAATQLFTPNWIVKYMVQNTIGAKWLETYPNSSLREHMEFYIEPAKQTDEVKSKLNEITPTSINPEELTLMDPACGSGHILIEAYNIFREIYLEQGYQRSEIPELILTKNLHGLEICPRAAQLATFSLLMKGREDDRRILESSLKLNVMQLLDSTHFNVMNITSLKEFNETKLKTDNLLAVKTLFSYSTTVGSLIKVPVFISERLEELTELAEKTSHNFLAANDLNLLSSLVKQAKLLASRYDAVVANPPYMGTNGMNNYLKEYVKENFPNSKVDLFACFIERGYELTNTSSYQAMITMQSWMFLSSFEVMRKRLLEEKTIMNMAHFGPRAFDSISGEIVQTTATIIKNNLISNYKPVFFRLVEGQAKEKCELLLKGEKRFDNISQDKFKKIPGSPVAYWISANIRNIFTNFSPITKYALPKKGMMTGDNAKFLRLHWEVSHDNIFWNCKSHAESLNSSIKWYPHNKGGEFRKWFGNEEFLVNFRKDGEELKQFKKYGERNPDLYFQEGFSWTKISSIFSARYSCEGHLYDDASCVCKIIRPEYIANILGAINSKAGQYIISSINQTLNFSPGEISKIPIALINNIQDIVSELISISESDWHAFERSLKFQKLPLLEVSSENSSNLELAYNGWIEQNIVIISKMRHLEEENNRLFINAYGLSEELIPDVPIEQITLTVNPAYRFKKLSEEDQKSRFQHDTIAEYLSYSVGCMMGRYSLDHPGLILADSRESQEAQISAYEAKVGKQISNTKFKPDLDGIIPVLDGEWFEDDIVARTREFIAVTFPESSVAENLRFIEASIGKDIRKYFYKDFYKDHLQTYKKRPIYWMVQSPKAGFACLIYLHRYTPETLLQVLNDYFRPYLQKLEARLTLLDLDQVNDSLSKREQIAARKEADKINKVIKECQDWEKEALLPLAQQRIKLDLDDGVKVNYPKLQNVLAKISGL